MYADYNFYCTKYNGTQIANEANFATAEIKAAYLIRRITFGRADKHIDSEDVKMAVCAAAEVFAALYDTALKGISSENNDGYAVAYSNLTQKSVEENAQRAAMTYLPPHMLYMGV